MESWQNSLKLSISQLNQNDVTTKLFNPSVVWQGSVVFGEVIFFSHFFFVLSICATSFSQISIYQNNALFTIKNFGLLLFCCSRIKQELICQDSVCVLKRARRWNPVSILLNVKKKGFSTFALF